MKVVTNNGDQLKVITNIGGQSWIELEEEGRWSLLPIHVWIEEQVAPQEIDLAFHLIADKREEEPDDDKVNLFTLWIFSELKRKYGSRWDRLIEDYLNSPAAGRLIAKIEINDLLAN